MQGVVVVCWLCLTCGFAEGMTVDLENRPLPRIPTGTEVGTAAPAGWSHLVLIASPTLSKEDFSETPRIAAHYAQLFKFTILARAGKGRGNDYQLREVARGFAVSIHGKDTIIHPQRTLGAPLGVFGPRILTDNEKAIDHDLRQVARTPTMLLFDAQVVMRDGAEHVRTVHRHALVIDAKTGQLYSFVWLLSKKRTGYALAEKEMQLLPDALREERRLRVRQDRFVLGLPAPDAFAVERIPQGRALPYTEELKKLAAVKDFSTEQVLALERALRAAGQAARQPAPRP